MRVLGVDPGSVSGAYALIERLDVVELVTEIDDLPVVAEGLDAAETTRRFRRLEPDIAIVERVGAMPGQGVSSMFKFGRAYGTILGVLAALEIPTVLVTPTVWKKHFKLPGKDKTRDISRELAIRLYPSVTGLSRKKDHNRAEALLLARYLLETNKR